ncbi:MAG: PorT family protein, partial [Bacteroidetes bacterium]|nr:PorT family protein [Bacteroidota bacterium]
PEVLFSQKGYQANTTDGTFTQRNDYIDIPLLAKFRLVRGFNFLIGPQINIPVYSTTTFDNGFNTSSESYYTDSSNKSYIAGAVGFSVDLNPNVDIHARYVIDLTSNTQDPNSPLYDYRNQVWQFGIGIKFQ